MWRVVCEWAAAGTPAAALRLVIPGALEHRAIICRAKQTVATVLLTLKPSSVEASIVASDALPPALPPTLATTLAIGVVYGSERRMRRKASGGCPPLNSLPGPPPSILKCGTPLTPAW